jgi:hypothetical protein
MGRRPGSRRKAGSYQLEDKQDDGNVGQPVAGVRYSLAEEVKPEVAIL